MKKILLAAALVAASIPAIATAEGEPGSGPNPYTQCGIGAAIFPTVGWAAAVSNATWDLGTTALSSALTSPEMCNAKQVNTAKYILETLPQLEQDVAAGNGEHLAGLTETMGCATEQAAITSNLRAGYSTTVEADAYAAGSQQDRALGMYNAVKAATAGTGCTVAL